MSAVNTDSIPPSHTNGVIEDGYDEDEKSKVRPADIDADMREMERRKRVELIMNSRLFREELERIIESQIKAGNSSAGLLQQISDMVGSKYSGVNNHLFRSASCAVPINDIRGVEAMGYAKGEKILRCKLAALFRLIDLYGWSQGIYNHVTARLSQQEEHFLVNPYGLLYSEVTASSLVKVDMQGNVIESGTTNFSVNVTGFQLHAAIYAARPDLKCIVHLHTPSVLAVSSLKDGLLPICQEAAVIGDISHHSYIGIPNEPEERDKIVRNLGPNNKVIFLTNHGALCCGETIEETFFYAYNTVTACETQLKVLPLGKDNLVLLSDETRKSMYDSARKIPENISPPVSNVPSAAAATEKRWRIGGLEFEALMRMLDNAGFRTGYVYRQPLIKGELPRPRNDVEVPPAVSSLGYLLEEEELYKGQWKKAFGGKGSDRIRWLNSPNVYQKVEILETGTSDPKKITKWVDANNEEWVADGSPNHTSTPVKIENALQFVPKNTNPKEFKKLQQQIKENRRADKITSGPQSHILEGVSWEEAKKLQDANMSGTSDQVILVGAASKGIIQREYQHNATVYKTPYAKNPFDAITDEEIENYKKDITRKQRGDSYYDEDESDALSSSLPPSGKRQNTGITSETEDESLTHEMRVIQIETTTVPKASQAEVVLSDDKANHKLSKSQAATKAFIKDNYDYYSEELRKFIVRIWEVKKSRPILTTISIGGESTLQPLCSATHCDADDLKRPSMGEMFKQIARELVTRFKQGSVFKQRSVRPAFLPIAAAAPEFHNVSFQSASFDCSDTEITTLIELPRSKHRFSRESLESVHDFSSDPTTEDEEDPMSPECEANRSSLMSLSSYIGQEYENPEESNEMTSSTSKTNVSNDTSFDDVTVICKDKSDGFELEVDEKGEFSDTSLSSGLMQDDDEDEDIPWNTYESHNDVDEDYFVHKNGDTTKLSDESVTSFVDKSSPGPRFRPELAVIYEELTVSDGKCSLKSILDDNIIHAVLQCERSDTPDTYVIEEEPNIDHDVWTSVRKCVASANALLDHFKNVKIDRNDSDTASAMANSITGADSDAHTISDTSLISCLADSTEDLEALKTDTCYDANDESERVLDSGILMEDVAMWSSEGDSSDTKLCSEVVSAEIASSVGGRTSSGSEEAEDAVWITQIEKIFDFDLDDLCLNRIFEENDEIKAPQTDTGQVDESLSEELDDLGVVVDTGPDDQSNEDIEQENQVDSIVQENTQADSVIDSDDQVEDQSSPEPCTFRNDVENMHNDIYDMDNQHLNESASSVDSIHTSIFINEPGSDPNLPSENYINAGVTLQVPETQTETETVSDSVSVEPETSSLHNEENISFDSRQNCSCNQSDIHSNCEICKYIEKTPANDVSEASKTSQSIDDFYFDFDVFDSIIIRILAAENELPCGVDDTFIEYKNLKDIFGESFLKDTNASATSTNDQSTSSTNLENTSSVDESDTNFDSSSVCNDYDITTATSDGSNVNQESNIQFDEENTSRTSDQIIPPVVMLVDLMCQMIADDSEIKETPQENGGQIETEKFDSDVLKDSSDGDSTQYNQNEIDHDPADHHEELSSQLSVTGIELNQDIVVTEENNELSSINDSNATNKGDNGNVSEVQIKLEESTEHIDDNEAEEKYSVYEPELSIESSENACNETVVEMDIRELTEDTEGSFATEIESFHEPSPCIESSHVEIEPSKSNESPENSDDVAIIENDTDYESSESAENIDYAESMENDANNEPSNCIESPEDGDNAASFEYDDPAEDIDYSDSTENDDNHEPSNCIESSEEDDDAASVENYDESESINSSGNIDCDESTENNDIHEPPNCIESLENDDNAIPYENDDGSELTETANSTEIIDCAESTDNDVIQEPSNCIESLKDDIDIAPELSKSIESTENIDHADETEDDVVHDPSNDIELTENDDDAVSVENNEGSEYSETIESIANTDDYGTVENDNIDEPSEWVESSENDNDDVSESSELEEQNEIVDDVEMTQNDFIEESSEAVESAGNSEDLVEIDEGISKSVESIESNGDIDQDTTKDDLCNESGENIESVENTNDIAPLEDDVISKSSETVESNENAKSIENIDSDVTVAENYVDSGSFEANENVSHDTVENTLNDGTEKNVKSIENINDDVPATEDDIVSKSPESNESPKNVECVTVENILSTEFEKSIESIENTIDEVITVRDVISKSSESIESNRNVDNVTAEKDILDEPEENVESTESSDQFFSAENDVIENSSEPIKSTETNDNIDQETSKPVELFENSNEVNDSHSILVENIDNAAILQIGSMLENSESIELIENIETDLIDDSSNIINLIENTTDSIIHSNDLVPTFPTEPESIFMNPIDKNHLENKSIVVQNDLVAIAHQFTSTSISSDTNEAICSLLGYLNGKKYILENISAAITNNSTEEAAADTSNDMNENYVTISDADSSSQHHRSYVTVSDASIEKSKSSKSPLIDDCNPSTQTSRSKSSPEQRKTTRKLVRSSVRVTNRKSFKRTSPPKKESSTDDEKRPGAKGSCDEKKPKLEQDVTEYSVKLKLRIEWDNKRSSTDSTSTKSSSFEDSLNCSESNSEGKRNKRENEQHFQGYESVTRLLADFKNDYPKFISYEYFSPKVKIQRTPRKASTPRPKPARKSQSLESSPTGRYHRYCHITRDLSIDNKSTVTPKRTSPSIIKNVHQVSQRTVRKPFKCRNPSTTSSLKTSTPVLTATEFLTKESIVECLTSNTLSPIANSLEEFELIESLLTSCEK